MDWSPIDLGITRQFSMCFGGLFTKGELKKVLAHFDGGNLKGGLLQQAD